MFLPDIDVDEVAKILKNEELKCIPNILSSVSIETLEARARESGVEGCLPKPFFKKQLNTIEKPPSTSV